ncbi:unnamed protein product, partial [Rotaria sp. Silwood2]
RRTYSCPETNQQKYDNDNEDKASGTTNMREDRSLEFANNQSKNDLIVSYVKEFLQKQSDFCWLTQQFDRTVVSDHFQTLVVHSTFPVNLDQSDFEYYIDMTFNNFPEDLRARMKNLFQKSRQNPISEDITFADHENGTVSATLVQILSQKNDRNELEMLVGSVSLTRRPSEGSYLCRSHWEQHKEQVKTALQYIYGKEAEKELSYE